MIHVYAFESEISDSYDDIIEKYADKDEGEEIFIQESIIIENSKTFDKKNIPNNETNNENNHLLVEINFAKICLE